MSTVACVGGNSGISRLQAFDPITQLAGAGSGIPGGASPLGAQNALQSVFGGALGGGFPAAGFGADPMMAVLLMMLLLQQLQQSQSQGPDQSFVPPGDPFGLRQAAGNLRQLFPQLSGQERNILNGITERSQQFYGPGASPIKGYSSLNGLMQAFQNGDFRNAPFVRASMDYWEARWLPPGELGPASNLREAGANLRTASQQLTAQDREILTTIMRKADQRFGKEGSAEKAWYMLSGLTGYTMRGQFSSVDFLRASFDFYKYRWVN